MNNTKYRGFARLLLLLTITLFSCQKDDKQGVSVSLSQGEVTSPASTVMLHVGSPNEWTISFSEKWIKPKGITQGAWEDANEELKGSGNADIELDIEENRNFDVRGVVVQLISRTNFAKAVLVQHASNIVLDPTEITFDHLCSTVNLVVNTSQKWSILNALDAPWCKFSQLKGGGYTTISLTLDDYTDRVGRKPVAIEFQCDGEIKKLTISHPFITVSEAKLLSPTDGEDNIVVTPTFTWSESENYEGGSVVYNLYLSENNADWKLIAENLTETSYTLTERLQKDKRYYWRVDAGDGVGNTTKGRSQSFITLPPDAYEDGEYRIYKEAKVDGAKAYNLVVMGDGFVSEDYLHNGVFDTQVDEIMTGFFEIEPFKTYKDYFRIIKIAAISAERGATIKKDVTTGDKPKAGAKNTIFGSTLEGGSSATISNPDNNKIYEYAKKYSPVNDDFSNSGVFLLINVNAAAGTTTTAREGQFIARTCLDDNKIARLIHEGGGHGVGRLKDEYIDSNESIPEEDKNTIIKYRAEKDDPFWYAGNVDITGDRDLVHWKHYFTRTGYERVGLYEGCYLYGKGAWRAEDESIMQGSKGILYFNAPSREAIVRRIARACGLTFSPESFFAKDVNTKPTKISNRSTLTEAHTPPVISE